MTSTQVSDQKFTLPAFRYNSSQSSSKKTDTINESNTYSDSTIMTEDLLSTIHTKYNNQHSKFVRGDLVLVRGSDGQLVKARFETYNGDGSLKCFVFQTGNEKSFHKKQVQKDRKMGLIRYNGYLFQQVYTDSDSGLITIRNLNNKPFGQSQTAPFSITVPASKVRLLHVEQNLNSTFNKKIELPNRQDYTLSAGSLPCHQLDDALLGGSNSLSGKESNSSIQSEQLLEWDSILEDKLPQKNSLVLVRENAGQQTIWLPAIVMSIKNKGIRCKVLLRNQVVLKQPCDVRIHDIRPSQILRYKDYYLRVVDVKNTSNPTSIRYVVKNLNGKPFGLRAGAPSLLLLPISEVSF